MLCFHHAAVQCPYAEVALCVVRHLPAKRVVADLTVLVPSAVHVVRSEAGKRQKREAARSQHLFEIPMTESTSDYYIKQNYLVSAVFSAGPRFACQDVFALAHRLRNFLLTLEHSKRQDVCL